MKKVVLAVAGLVVLYLGAIVVLAAQSASRSVAFNAEKTRLADFGDKAAAGLTTAASELPELSEACKALPHAASSEVFAYRTPGSSADAALKAPQLIGVGESGYPEELERPWREYELEWFVFELASDVPTSWGWIRQRYRSPFNHELDTAKYLVVYALEDVDPPRPAGPKSYVGGTSTWRAAVVSARDGKVLCTGVARHELRDDVRLSGRGKTDAEAEEAMRSKTGEQLEKAFYSDLSWFYLRHMCSLGGEGLCSQVFGTYVP